MYNLFSKFRDYLVYREAVRLADAQHEKNHSRYYVVPSKSGKLMVVDRKNFRILKRKHYVNSTATLKDMEIECFYHTPHGNESGKLSHQDIAFKRRKYFAYCRTIRSRRPSIFKRLSRFFSRNRNAN